MSELADETERRSARGLQADAVVRPDRSTVFALAAKICFFPALGLIGVLTIGIGQSSPTTVLVTAVCLGLLGAGFALGVRAVLWREITVDHGRDQIRFTRLAHRRRWISIRAEKELIVSADSIRAGYERYARGNSTVRGGPALIVLLPDHIVTLPSGIWDLDQVDQAIGRYLPEHSDERHWGDRSPLIMTAVLFVVGFGTTAALAWFLYW